MSGRRLLRPWHQSNRPSAANQGKRPAEFADIQLMPWMIELNHCRSTFLAKSKEGREVTGDGADGDQRIG
jgi:hypothetical protein